jgi:hypothetical protein
MPNAPPAAPSDYAVRMEFVVARNIVFLKVALTNIELAIMASCTPHFALTPKIRTELARASIALVDIVMNEMVVCARVLLPARLQSP